MSVDAILAQDLGIAEEAAVRTNELYTSQYIDHTVLQDRDLGFVLCSRQNLPQGGAYPWVAHGCLDGAVGLPDRRVPVLRPELSRDERPCGSGAAATPEPDLPVRVRAAHASVATGPSPAGGERRDRVLRRRSSRTTRAATSIERPPPRAGSGAGLRPSSGGAGTPRLRSEPAARATDGASQSTRTVAPHRRSGDRLRCSIAPTMFRERGPRGPATSTASSVATGATSSATRDGTLLSFFHGRSGTRRPAREGAGPGAADRSHPAFRPRTLPDRRHDVGDRVDGRRLRLAAHDRQHLVQQAAERGPQSR